MTVSGSVTQSSLWLINVIETYLANKQQSALLTADILCQLSHEMLSNYSITANVSESKAVCLRLIGLLESNGHIPPFQEPFPVDTQYELEIRVDSWTQNTESSTVRQLVTPPFQP